MLGSQLQIILVPSVNPQDILTLSNPERIQFSAEMGRLASEQTARIRNEHQRREMEEVLCPDQRERLTEIDLHEGLESTLTMLGHKLKHVTLTREYDPNLPRYRRCRMN